MKMSLWGETIWWNCCVEEAGCTGEDKEVGRSHGSDTLLTLDDSTSLDVRGENTGVSIDEAIEGDFSKRNEDF